MALKVIDTDSDSMQIRIKATKGKKEHMATFAKTTLQILSEYVKEYQPAKYLFEGQVVEEHYSKRSTQKVFGNVFNKK